jgi:hypothetical protein
VPAIAVDAVNILNFAAPGSVVDRTGKADASPALSGAIRAANVFTARGEPACVYIPPGQYRITVPPPEFIRAGCVRGDGPTQSTLLIDRSFAGDVFAWSEAWAATTAGPTISGLRILGDRTATTSQNAMVFYDRNDSVAIDNVEVDLLHGRALYAGVCRHAPQAYMREAHMRDLRFFKDGAPGLPVVEFSSEGAGRTDATNEIAVSQIDIYGAADRSLVIRNGGSGAVRSITLESLRIEGLESGQTHGDLLTIGDRLMPGKVNNIRLTDVELLDAAAGYAALRVTAAPNTAAPYQISFQGAIGGGVPRGEGIHIEAGRNSLFRLSAMHTLDTNVVIGPGIQAILLDGGGAEKTWTLKIDKSSRGGVMLPATVLAMP